MQTQYHFDQSHFNQSRTLSNMSNSQTQFQNPIYVPLKGSVDHKYSTIFTSQIQQEHDIHILDDDQQSAQFGKRMTNATFNVGSERVTHKDILLSEYRACSIQ